MSMNVDVVLTDCFKVARQAMRADWGWPEKRVSNAILVRTKQDLAKLRGVQGANVFVSGDYPDKDGDKIFQALRDPNFRWGDPRAELVQ